MFIVNRQQKLYGSVLFFISDELMMSCSYIQNKVIVTYEFIITVKDWVIVDSLVLIDYSEH